MYKVKEAAKILGFTELTIRNWIKIGKINAIKVFSQWRIPEDEIYRLKNGNVSHPTPKGGGLG